MADADPTASIEEEIEETRDRLASTIDQLLHRTNPKTIMRRQMDSVKATFVDAEGNPRTENILKVVGGVAGLVTVVVVIRHVTR